MAKHVAGDDKVLLAKLRRDIASYSLLLVGKVVVIRFNTLSIIFLEFACSVRIMVFILS